MKFAVSVLILAFAIGAVSVNAAQKTNLCKTGNVRGFAEVQGDPRLGGIGALPSEFSRASGLFGIQYNCTGRGVWAKRVDEGVYDVWFPDNPAKVAIVSAVNQQGATAAVDRIGDATFRISIRGPVVDNNVLIRRELPFYIIVT